MDGGIEKKGKMTQGHGQKCDCWGKGVISGLRVMEKYNKDLTDLKKEKEEVEIIITSML